MSINYRLLKNADYFLNETDAVAMILRQGLSPEQTYNVTMSGGSKEFQYSVVLGYYNQQGVIINSGYDRYNMRGNLNYRSEKWRVNFGTSFMRDDKDIAAGSSLSNAMNYKPYSPVLDPDASSFEVPGLGYSNEVSVIEPLLRSFRSRFQDMKSTYSANLGIDYDVTKSFTLSTKFGYNNQSLYGHKFVPNIPIYDSAGTEVSVGEENSYVSNTSSRREGITWYGSANYNKTIKGHKINLMALASYEQYDFKGFDAGRYAVENGGIDDAVVNMGTYRPFANSLNYYNDKLFGLIGRVMYSYKSRYILNASLRADASSKFSANNRWGYFPSVSAGWNIAEEAFWQPIRSTINSFKLRASYGMTGNQSFTSYSYYTTLDQGYDYVFGPNTSYGQTQVNFANENVKWETSVQSNIGFDLGFLENSITLAGDYYHTDKRDMLAQVRLPASSGGGTSTNAIMYQNVGNMVNRGFELALNYKKTFTKGFRLQAGINFTKNDNKVTALASGNEIMYNANSTLIAGDPNSVTTFFAKGYEAGAFFLYQTGGIANTPEKLKAFQAYKPDAQLGDMIFLDTNGDKQLTDADRVYCGSGMADLEMGFNLSLAYKGFDLTTNWFASIGNEILNGAEAMSYDKGRNELLKYQYSAANPHSEIPVWRGNGKEHMNYIGYSDLWVEDGSYLRLKAITLGYTLPKSVTQKIHIDNKLRFFVTGQNLFTFTGYRGMDPEVGGNGLTTRGLDKGGYPVSQKYMMGLKLEF